MVRTIASAAAVAALLPMIWVTSAVWATGLSAGLVAYELRHRLSGATGRRAGTPRR